MKKIVIIFFYLLGAIHGNAQIMQASIGAGSAPNKVKIYIKSTLPINGNISTLQFSVAIPGPTAPAPTLSITGIPLIGTGWAITSSAGYLEAGFRNYDIITAASFTVNMGANIETEVMELQFNNGPVNANIVKLTTLPGGGIVTSQTLFYCTGVANSDDVVGLYYTRPGTTVINTPSYTGPDESSATVSGVILPVSWVSFNAIKQGNNAILNWLVANEEKNHHFELLRSTNGTDYKTIATINKSVSGSTTYSYTDPGINNLATAILYYRIKQVDIDGKSSNSEIRTLKLETKENPVVSIFPNPVKNGFYISIPFVNRDKRPVKLNLFGANGQIVGSREITTSQASNYYFNIKDNALAAGEYYLQIIFENKLLETKKIFISH